MKKIIVVISCLTAAVSLAYALWQKFTAESRIMDAEIKTMMKFRRISNQYVFPHPTENELKRFTGESCRNIAYQLKSCTYSDNDYGNLSRECAVLLLNTLAKNVPDGKNLDKYFSEK